MKTRLSAEEMIKKHEGLELKPYKCPAGKLTIGYGRNLEDVGISQEEAEFLLESDIHKCVRDLESFDFWDSLDGARQDVLIDMRYNLGPSRLRSFKNMIIAVSIGDYEKAAAEMKDSRWYNQVGSRSKYLCEVMRTGQR